ncbi:MAG TPA: isoprenyl transferase [Anaerolineaceae bacterium]|nr:isoprenyl transferase [Anaerolineaceae bacterium]
MNEIPAKIPVHIAIIMDGNGRWAEAHGLPRLEGHRAGTENLRQIIKGCAEIGVQHLTLYAFSTENWRRPKAEVEGLLTILETYLDKEVDELCAEGVRLHHIGRLEAMPDPVRRKVEHSMEVTCGNTRLVLHLAWNYGGRDEIVHAVQRIIEDGIAPEAVTEGLVDQYLFTCGTPDPDLIIRTSGEMRVSNFLIWQGAYSEWYVTPTLWPDFSKKELYKAIEIFGQRERRFGKISSTEDET